VKHSNNLFEVYLVQFTLRRVEHLHLLKRVSTTAKAIPKFTQITIQMLRHTKGSIESFESFGIIGKGKPPQKDSQCPLRSL
jgi:hypothetical protein